MTPFKIHLQMPRFFSGAAAILLTAALYVPAPAMDCDQTAGIAYDLHTSKHSSSLDEKTLEQARKYYEQTLSNCPGYCRNHPELCNNLGDVYKRLGMKDRALSLFRTAAREKPDYGDALFEIGMILEEKGLLGAALDAYLKALDTNPRDREAEARARSLTDRLCSMDGYGRTAAPGEILDRDALFDSVVAQKTFDRARKRFNLCRKNIFVVCTALRNIPFATGSAVLDPRSNEQLAELAGMMTENREIGLVIEGHTDDRPIRGVIEVSPGVYCRDNDCLSRERARSLLRELTARGIASNRMTAEGYGHRRPMDRLDRSKNRRVQLRMGDFEAK